MPNNFTSFLDFLPFFPFLHFSLTPSHSGAPHPPLFLSFFTPPLLHSSTVITYPHPHPLPTRTHSLIIFHLSLSLTLSHFFRPSPSLLIARAMAASTQPPHKLSFLALPWGTLHPFIFLLLLFSVPVKAQQSSSPPMAVGSMAYTTVNEDTLFMQGGVSYGPAGPTTNQFYTLDLTQPTWTTVNPPWRARVYPESLNLIARINKHSISVSPDKQNLTFWVAYPGMVLNYTIATDTWTQVSKPSQLTSSGDLHAETDPRTGLVYYPGGYNNVSMGVYNPATQSFTPATSPNGFVNDRFYAFVWSEVRNTFIFFGNTPIRETNPFVEYSTSTNKWTALVCLSSICLDSCSFSITCRLLCAETVTKQGVTYHCFFHTTHTSHTSLFNSPQLATSPRTDAGVAWFLVS